MRENKTPLTDEQRKLVEDNHDLIYWFTHKYKLKAEHYYYLAFGLCKAAQNYDNTKGKFTTYAHLCMRRETNRYFAANKRDCRYNQYGVDISTDTVVMSNRGNSATLGELIPVYVDYADIIDNQILLQIIGERLHKLSDRNREILKLFWSGYARHEIAEMLGISRERVRQVINTWGAKVTEGLHG